MKSRASISDERLSSDRERMRFYPLPTDSVIRSTLERFEKSDYCARERKIIAFFQRLLLNNNRADVLLKATALKSFMGSPNIYLPFITHYILSEKDFDNKLQRGVKSIVEGITASSRARWKYASFARRYCAFHRPDLYLGSGWEIGLVMYERLYGFMQGESFSGGTGYAAHTKPFWTFRKVYGLEKYSLPDLQHFLRQLYHEESEYNEHCHADKDSKRCSQNAFILNITGRVKSPSTMFIHELNRFINNDK